MKRHIKHVRHRPMWPHLPCRLVFVPLAIMLTCAQLGCTVVHQVGTTLVNESAFTLANRKIDAKIRRAAKQASKACLPSNCSRDFQHGFEAGFAGFAHTGSHLPPVFPPRKYRSANYLDQSASCASTDWFNGYREGTLFADQSGVRQLVTLPASLSDPVSWDHASVDTIESEWHHAPVDSQPSTISPLPADEPLAPTEADLPSAWPAEAPSPTGARVISPFNQPITPALDTEFGFGPHTSPNDAGDPNSPRMYRIPVNIPDGAAVWASHTRN